MAAPMKNIFVMNMFKRTFNQRLLFDFTRSHRNVGSQPRPCYCMSTTSASENSEKSEISSLAQAFKQASLQQTVDSVPRSFIRTSETNPMNHRPAHEGLYYTVEKEDFDYYVKSGQHPKFYQMCKAFNECCIMVRKPATEIFQCLSASNMSLPVIRYVLYGRHGVGKSITLSHIMQYVGRQGWLVVHIPWVPSFVTFPREVQASPYRPERGDTPVDCAHWLNYFQSINQHILSKLTTRNKYTWSKREIMEPGITFKDLLEFAVVRPKYAGDVMGAVLKEIKQQSTEGEFKTLVAIDGANALWGPTSVRKVDDKSKKYLPEEMSVVHNLRKLLKNDWTGGAVVVVADVKCAPTDQQESYMPRYLLPKEAIDHLEPHIPIHVEDFDDKEASSCLQYFIDRKWIQRPEGSTEDGQKEILFLSSKNPAEMYRVCSRW